MKSIPIYNSCLFEAGLTRNQPPEKQVESSLSWNFSWLCDLLSPFFSPNDLSQWLDFDSNFGIPSGKKTNCSPSKRHEFHCKFPIWWGFTDSPSPGDWGCFPSPGKWRKILRFFGWISKDFKYFPCEDESGRVFLDDMMTGVVATQRFFYVHPEPWGFLIQFDEYFSKGLKPPTRWLNQVWGVFFASLFRCFFLKRPTEELMVDIFIRWGTLAFVEPSRWWLGCWYHHYHWI